MARKNSGNSAQQRAKQAHSRVKSQGGSMRQASAAAGRAAMNSRKGGK